MKEVILYPTETIYALGVNAFDVESLELLAQIKGRPVSQAVSCLVRSAADIERYAVVTPVAKKMIEAFLPGPLTIELSARPEFAGFGRIDDLIGFRISPDKVAQQTIATYMDQFDVPLTCTSANLHGHTPGRTPTAILDQLGKQADWITKVIDDGVRVGEASTVINCAGDSVQIIRPGAIPTADIYDTLTK